MKRILSKQRICLCLLVCSTFPLTSNADLSMQRTVIISPKTGPATANIGAVGVSCDVKMKEARVDITVGEPQQLREGLIEVRTRAVFRMRNVSRNQLAVTVGFPVSDSEYSAFALMDFAVSSNREVRSVFNSVTGYPNRLVHDWVSGPKVTPDVLPDADSKGDLFGNEHGHFGGDKELDGHGEKARPFPRGLFRSVVPVDAEVYDRNAPFRLCDLIPAGVGGRSPIAHNLMVWREDFAPGEERVIEVRYAMEIPIQKNKSVTKRVVSKEKGVSRDEANNCPMGFLQTLERGNYYFYDYFLTSGASWKGPIGRETITLHLPESWSGCQVYCSQPERLKQTVPLTWTYTLTNEEPTENLYFAVPADSRRVL